MATTIASVFIPSVRTGPRIDGTKKTTKINYDINNLKAKKCKRQGYMKFFVRIFKNNNNYEIEKLIEVLVDEYLVNFFAKNCGINIQSEFFTHF